MIKKANAGIYGYIDSKSMFKSIVAGSKQLWVFIVVILVVTTMFSINLAFSRLAQNTPSPAPAGNSLDEGVSSWKFWISPSGKFVFQYPGDLYTVDVLDDRISLYRTIEEAQSATDCDFQRAGTLEKPCGEGMVLNIGALAYPKAGYHSLNDLYDANNPSLPKTRSITDTKGRVWTLLGPIWVSDVIDLEAEINRDHEVYHVVIQAGVKGFESYFRSKGAIGEGILHNPGERYFESLAVEILSTFQFAD